MKELIDKGYARSEFVGRRREVSLTPKGEMVADAVADYRAKLLAAKALYT
jgi:DNA-binding MarR family transcriptional regulator